MTITATPPRWQTQTRPDTNWTRVVVPTVVIHHGTSARRLPVFVTIKWHDGNLSMTGVEGPTVSGNAYGGWGQIMLSPLHPADGWESSDVTRLTDIWTRWHLNTMTAGSPDQEQWIREHRAEFPGYPTDHYKWTCDGLADAGLNPDCGHDGYCYGSAWLTEDVPADVLDYLHALPNTTKAHPWGKGA